MTNIQEKTPLFDALLSYKNENPTSFHVPGHKNGSQFHRKGTNVFGNLLQIDATEVEGLDDLHAPAGPILEAQELLSKLYNTKKSFFLVNGTTCGNLAMILGVCEEGDIVLVQKNCHKSILNGLMLAKAKPVFLPTIVNEEWGTAEGVSPEAFRKATTLYPLAKAVILTYPSYYGIGENIEELIHIAHDSGLKVLVDEAHGAHFIAGEPFLESSLAYGADYVVHSAHKTLPAMTMGSYLHVNHRVEDSQKVEMYLQILQSSSPSYPIMASLDLARSYMGSLTERDLQYTKKSSFDFRSQLDKIEGIKVLQHKEGAYDILKVVVQTDGTFSGFQLQAELQKNSIYTELADSRNVLFVLPIIKDGQTYSYEKVITAIRKAISSIDKHSIISTFLCETGKSGEITELDLTFTEMNIKEKRYIPIKKSIGYISAEMITPYPPGVPLIMNGEKITAEKVAHIEQMISLGARFHGASKLHLKKFLVYV